MALAWATVVFLVLLLPGFVFLAGLISSSRFSRDAMPQNAVGQLAGIVLVSFVVHAFLVLVLSGVHPAFGARKVDFHVLLSALQAGQGGALPVDRLAANLERYWLQIVGYVGTTVVLSFTLGRVVGWLAVKRQLRLFVQYEWVYQLDQRDSSRSLSIITVFVLTHVAHDARQLGYEGFLEQFNLRPDGSFSYLLLRQPKKFVLDITSDALQATDPSQITPRSGGENPEGTYLHVPGEEIRNVVFRQHPVVSSSKDGLEALDRALQARRGTESGRHPESPGSE